MYTPPKTWVRGALAGIALAAVAGLVIGVGKGGAGAPGAMADPGSPTPSSTTLAKALPDGPLIDEDRVRTLARQEAEAAISRSRPAKKAVVTDAGDDSADEPATPTASTPTSVAKPAAARSPAAMTPAAGSAIPF